MDQYREAKLKDMAMQEGMEQKCNAAPQYESSTLCGEIRGMMPDVCGRPSLTASIHDQLNRAVRESRKAERLHRLTYLLGKNPEVAEILDLIEEVKY